MILLLTIANYTVLQSLSFCVFFGCMIYLYVGVFCFTLVRWVIPLHVVALA